ncbi:DinB family protein [Luteirhabdus pelagi]|uniref:DinB family protein n=1 Tax=Luteirhabdus pelagi TaxID=2792783 RepID=UPI00193A8B7B|nr:DinB family protein [Luteirhabdus pelagi]
MKRDAEIKTQLSKHLQGGMAFLLLKDMLEEVPFEKITVRPAELPYSVYELLYHITFTQKDILDYCNGETYTLPNWPDDYWPETNTVTEKEWFDLKKSYFDDRDAFEAMLKDGEKDLLSNVKHSDKHSYLRETLLILEHTAYHSGQLLVLLRLLGVHN